MNDYEVTIDTFNRLASQYQEKYLDSGVYRETYRDFLDLILPEHKSLLDIGCGPGSVSLYLKQQFPDLLITGVDPAPKMIELAQKNIPDGEFFAMDARDICAQFDTKKSRMLKLASFDLIVCGFCIPYLAPDDVAGLIRDCRRLVRGNGLLYLSFIEGDIKDSRMMTNDQDNSVFQHFYAVDDIKKLLGLNNFSVINQQVMKIDPDNNQLDTDVFLIARCGSDNKMIKGQHR